MGYPWFFVFVSLVAKKMVLGPNVIFVLLVSYFWVLWLVLLCAFHAFKYGLPCFRIFSSRLAQ